MPRTWSIRTKITLSFAGLFLAAAAALAVGVTAAVARTVEGRIRREVSHLASVLATSGFSPSRERRPKGKAVTGRDLARLAVRREDRPDGSPLVRRDVLSTLSPEAEREFSGEIERRGFPPPGARGSGEIALSLGGKRYLAFWHEPTTAADAGTRVFLFLLLPAEEIGAARWRAAAPVLVIAGGALALVLALGYLLAATITRPLSGLVERTRSIAGGDLSQRLDRTGTAELDELSMAFNRMVESLAASRERLVRSERAAAVGTVAAGVAHEIRNPLTSVRLNIQMLRESLERGAPFSEKDREALGVLLGEIDRIEIAIDELLTFARPSPPELAPVDIRELIEATTGLFERQIRHAGVELEREIEPGLPAVGADARKLRQVLVNLILNALGAMPGGGRLTIRVARSGDAARIVLEVADTGGGIPDEIAARVFEPFVTTKPGGSGLGLAVTKQIVEAHNGEIDFRTGASGTTFRVSLPAG